MVRPFECGLFTRLGAENAVHALSAGSEGDHLYPFVVLAFIRPWCGNASALLSRPSDLDKGVWYAVQATLGEEPGTQGLAFVQLAANHGGCLFRF